MVLRLETCGGTVVHAIGVPQDRPSRTGPTWAYLFNADGLTLIDPGAHGSFHELASGIAVAGFAVKDVDRLVLSHGHYDHDGSTAQVISESGASLWAHQVYASLLEYAPWNVQQQDSSPFHAEVARLIRQSTRENSGHDSPVQNDIYLVNRRELHVDHPIRNGDTFGKASVVHTPGHSPDEICITLDGIVFTGDHILPEITPHPTTKVAFRDEVSKGVPDQYRETGDCFGLERYMRSLKSVMEFGTSLSILPAHRLYNRNSFNFLTLIRAEEIICHHAQRLSRVLERAGDDPAGLEEFTWMLFRRGTLAGRGLYMAMSEVVAHIEVLLDVGDLEQTVDGRFKKTGSTNYMGFIQELIG